MSAQEQIAGLLAADAPPARDVAFEIAVARRIEQRRLVRELTLIVGAGAASAVWLALLMPFLATFWQTYFAGSSTLVAAVALVAAGVLTLQGNPQRE